MRRGFLVAMAQLATTLFCHGHGAKAALQSTNERALCSSASLHASSPPIVHVDTAATARARLHEASLQACVVHSVVRTLAALPHTFAAHTHTRTHTHTHTHTRLHTHTPQVVRAAMAQCMLP